MASNVPLSKDYLNSIATYLTTMRDTFKNLSQQSEYIASMGNVAFLTAAPPDGLGMIPSDANALIATLGNHTNLGIQYTGGNVAPKMDYEASGQPFWGGR